MKTLQVGRQKAEIKIEGRTFSLKEHTAKQADKFQALLTRLFSADGTPLQQERDALQQEVTDAQGLPDVPETVVDVLYRCGKALEASWQRERLPDSPGRTPGEQALVDLAQYILGKDQDGNEPEAEWILEELSTRAALELVDAQHELNSYDNILGKLTRRNKTPAAAGPGAN